MCNECNEPKGSLSNPRVSRHPNAQQRAQHVKGVGRVKCKATGQNVEIFPIGKARQEPAWRRTRVRRGTGSQV